MAFRCNPHIIQIGCLLAAFSVGCLVASFYGIVGSSPSVLQTKCTNTNELQNASQLQRSAVIFVSEKAEPESQEKNQTWFETLITPELIKSEPMWSQILYDASLDYKHWKPGRDFPVSQSMLRSTRSVVGRMDRLWDVLDLVTSGQCITIMAIGGSVTAGHGTGGESFTYSARLVEWLNAKYPCKSNDGQAADMHKVLNRGYFFGGSSSRNAVSNFVSIMQLAHIKEPVDLVIVEFQVNDSFMLAKKSRLGSA